MMMINMMMMVMMINDDDDDDDDDDDTFEPSHDCVAGLYVSSLPGSTCAMVQKIHASYRGVSCPKV